ncbi:hypothetical protein [Rhodopseudomonas sp. RCAM05734]|uniref:hypothetical protein n=1 Tax=Rhodopseudomonas sp. RCAM05734 TaxID=3457549 RepID=UPI0040444FEF
MTVGFASVNIADVTLTRASRVTPAVTIAQDALRDAVTARNRACTGGVGRFCREREQIVNDRQHALDAAMNLVEHAADPQTDAAAKIVAWLDTVCFISTTRAVSEVYVDLGQALDLRADPGRT